MKTIKNFLFKKRIKILKSKRGFSLLEVLVAVAIIGIISAIAVPSYQANRKEAAKVAGMTSIQNIYKAYQNCIVLKGFAECNTLAKIGISCPDCKEDSDDGTDATKTKFCAYISKESGGKTFNACVSINGDSVKRSIGGTLLDEVKICHEQNYDTSGGGSWPSSFGVMEQIKYCEGDTECGTDSTCSTCTASDKKYKCQKSADDGDCSSKVCA